jgi:hypothetical protein
MKCHAIVESHWIEKSANVDSLLNASSEMINRTYHSREGWSLDGSDDKSTKQDSKTSKVDQLKWNCSEEGETHADQFEESLWRDRDIERRFGFTFRIQPHIIIERKFTDFQVASEI